MTTDATTAAGEPPRPATLLASLVAKIDDVLNAIQVTDACLAASDPDDQGVDLLRRQLDDFAGELATARRACCELIAVDGVTPPPASADRRLADHAETQTAAGAPAPQRGPTSSSARRNSAFM